MALKERAMRLCHAACGHRLLFDAIAPGGLGRPMLEDRRRFGSELAALEGDVHDYVKWMFANASMTSRWERAGVVPPEALRAFGAVGPAARAGGGSSDIRAFAPYGAYREFAPAVAGANASDVFARAAVKRDEVLESLTLIRRALFELGSAALPVRQPVEPQPGIALKVVEGARGAEFVAVHLGEGGVLERVHVISASYRNWPLVARAMENNIVPDFPLVNKSFNLCYACADR
jgi:Ni,Fe-hydrogenase III large subunit